MKAEIPTSRRSQPYCALALPRLALAQKQQGVSKNEIVLGTIQDLSGPLAGYGKQVRIGMQLRMDELNETGRHPRPQAQAAGRGRRLRPQEGGAGRAEAGQPGQDLRHGRPPGHGAEHGGDAGAVREERHQLLADHRRARDVRAAAQRLKYAIAATYYDQMRIGRCRGW